MTFLLSLWLPILVTTVVLFFASFLAWVVLPHHKPDIKSWPDEGALLRFVRDSGVSPGEYMFPLIDQKDLKEEWAVRRYEEGPWGMVNIWPAKPNMGANMIKTVLFFLAVTILVAYVGLAALPAGAAFGEVFRIVGVTAILAHTTGGICREIWFTRPLRAKLMDALDGIVFGLLTGVIFALMWP